MQLVSRRNILPPYYIDKAHKAVVWLYEVTDRKRKDYLVEYSITFREGDYEITHEVLNEDTDEAEQEVVNMSIQGFMQEHGIEELDAQGMDITERQLELKPIRETAKVKRARQALAGEQAAWNVTMGKTLHLGVAWGKKTVALCGNKTEGTLTRYLLQVTCEGCKAMHERGDAYEDTGTVQTESKVECAGPVQYRTLYTVAPVALDQEGTTSEASAYVCDTGAPLRKVTVVKTNATAQMNAYLAPIVYLSYSDKALEAAMERGVVTTINTKDTTMAKKTPQIPAVTGMAPLGMTEESLDEQGEKAIARMEQALRETEKARAEAKARKQAADFARSEATILRNTQAPSASTVLPAAKIRTLDAILATPIAPCPTVRTETPKKALALPEERTEAELVRGMAPQFAMHADMYKVFVQAFRQALAEEGLVIVPKACLHAGCGEDTSIAEPEPVTQDPMAECLASIHDAALACTPAPVKPVSTLKLGKDIPTKAGTQRPSTVDPKVAKAIQQAWNNRAKVPVTQAQLAQKYGIDDKKVWFLIHRAKQLV